MLVDCDDTSISSANNRFIPFIGGVCFAVGNAAGLFMMSSNTWVYTSWGIGACIL